MRMKRRPVHLLTRLLLITVLAHAVGACERDVAEPDQGATNLPSHLLVAQGLSLALADDGLRTALRFDMRDSPWTQHKLVLQDYVETPAGRTLVNAAARELGVPVAHLEQAIESLPLMDFYLPNRTQRLSWTGSSSYVVGVTLQPDALTYVTFSRSGFPGLVTREAARELTHALLLLHPIEPKGERLILESESGSETIQQTWIEPYYVKVVTTEADGAVTERQILKGADSSASSLGSTQAYVFQNAYLRQFDPNFEDSGDCEIIYRARLYAANGSTVKITETTDYDVPCPAAVNYVAEDPLGNGHYLMDVRPSLAGEEFHVRVTEDDTFNNDDKGSLYWTAAHDEGFRSRTAWSAVIGW